MLYGSYRFKCRFESDAHLPEYKGSTFRGVFGRALKQVVCALRRQTCPDCLLRSECLYPNVFEPHLTLDFHLKKHKTTKPHPYVIQPPNDSQTEYSQGAPFEFNLLLFGLVNQNLPYFIYALDRMGHIGIGKKIHGRRAKFQLEEVKSNGVLIYQCGDKKLTKLDPFINLTLSQFEDSCPFGNGV